MISYDEIAKQVHNIESNYLHSIGKKFLTWEEAGPVIQDLRIKIVTIILENNIPTPEYNHQVWKNTKIKDGWIYGDVLDYEKKTHPFITEYENLDHEHRFKDAILFSVVDAYRDLIERKL